MSPPPPPCPNCQVPLRAVTAPARTGYLLALDQCTRCGGLWCDRWELFPIDAAAVDQLDPVDQSALWAPTPAVTRELKCPRGHGALRRFHDPVLPADARIERCPSCDGMWLNRGELRRFKSGRGETPSPQPLPNAALQSLLGRYAQVANWPTVTQLSNATETALDTDDDAPMDISSELMWSALWIGARALLALLLSV